MRSLLLLAALLAVAPQGPRANGNIAGTVTRNGTDDGIINVRVWLEGGDSRIGDPRQGAGRSEIETFTDINGRFELTDVPPGQFVVHAFRGGYVAVEKKLILSPGQRVTGLDLALQRGAVISGRVFGPHGKPFVDQRVEAGGSLARTNDLGEYRIIGLKPGGYRILARDGQSGGGGRSPASKPTYYPGTGNSAEATVIEVGEGDIRTGYDFAVLVADPPEPVFKVKGTLVSPSGSLGNAQIQTVRFVPRGSAARTAGQTVIPFPPKPGADKSPDPTRREFEVNGVRRGTYDAFFVLSGAGNEWVGARTTIDVSGQDVTGLIVIADGVEVRGQVSLVGARAEVSKVAVSLSLPEAVGARLKVDANGGFNAPLIQGTWKVRLSLEEPVEGLALFDVQQGNRSIYESGLVVGVEPPEQIRVILGPIATVTGIVRDDRRQPAADAKVVLIPTDANTSSALYRKAAADDNGQFSIAAVGSGEYAVYVFPREMSLASIPVTSESLREFLAAQRLQPTILKVTAGVPISVTLIK